MQSDEPVDPFNPLGLGYGDGRMTLQELMTGLTPQRHLCGLDDPLVEEVISSLRREVSDLQQRLDAKEQA
jgi:hypothetical protein